MAAQCVLADGIGNSRDFLSGSIYLGQEPTMPVPGLELTYAESPDSEGRLRVRTRPTNPEGQLPLIVTASSAVTFWDLVDELQELVASAHRNRGTLTWQPTDDAQAVIFDLESASISELPQRGVFLRTFVCEPVVSFETRPYGRLTPVTLVA